MNLFSSYKYYLVLITLKYHTFLSFLFVAIVSEVSMRHTGGEKTNPVDECRGGVGERGG
jgi:hypothetical protein